MYKSFYNLKEKPFNTTPDSRFFFPSDKHLEALNSLIYAINERKGFVVITGEIGAGKTTVCRTLLSKLEANTKVGIITNTHLTPKELIAQILEEFEVEHKSGNKQKLLSCLNDFLINQLAQDINVVLIIDEAQNLSPTALEEVRMLSNLETETEKLIQIILMGQPQLRKKLENPRLLQFRQRVAVYFHLNALNRKETEDYIQHRLRLASLNGADIFTAKAVEAIFNHSQGIPRLINLLCDSALLTGYIFEHEKINENIINSVAKEREINRPAGKASEESAGKTHCCPRCAAFDTCRIKWLRGTKGEEQLCCPACGHFEKCDSSVSRSA